MPYIVMEILLVLGLIFIDMLSTAAIILSIISLVKVNKLRKELKDDIEHIRNNK